MSEDKKTKKGVPGKGALYAQRKAKLKIKLLWPPAKKHKESNVAVRVSIGRGQTKDIQMSLKNGEGDYPVGDMASITELRTLTSALVQQGFVVNDLEAEKFFNPTSTNGEFICIHKDFASGKGPNESVKVEGDDGKEFVIEFSNGIAKTPSLLAKEQLEEMGCFIIS